MSAKAEKPSPPPQEGWPALESHRIRAKAYRLKILVWGPTNDGSHEYAARCRLRDELCSRGHDARFSEDLCSQPSALPDPIHDERLQAAAAHLIVMIYGSRGTQTERDVIVADREIAGKAIILIEKEFYRTIKTRSLAGRSWEQMEQLAKVMTYRKGELDRRAVSAVCRVTEDMRVACYVQELRLRNLNGG